MEAGDPKSCPYASTSSIEPPPAASLPLADRKLSVRTASHGHLIPWTGQSAPSLCLAPSILSPGQLGVSQVQPLLLLNKNPPVPAPATL